MTNATALRRSAVVQQIVESVQAVAAASVARLERASRRAARKEPLARRALAATSVLMDIVEPNAATVNATALRRSAFVRRTAARAQDVAMDPPARLERAVRLAASMARRARRAQMVISAQAGTAEPTVATPNVMVPKRFAAVRSIAESAPAVVASPNVRPGRAVRLAARAVPRARSV